MGSMAGIEAKTEAVEDKESGAMKRYNERKKKNQATSDEAMLVEE